MKCAICGSELKKEMYVSLDIWDHVNGRYASMLCCPDCIEPLLDRKKLLRGNCQYSVNVKLNKDYDKIAQKPLRKQCGSVWMFAKSQIEGLYDGYFANTKPQVDGLF